MERVIEKLSTKNEGLKLVVDELIKQCEKEPAFIEKILSEKKSLSECWEYIKSRAKKEAEGNCAMVDNLTVYGWAIHYFDEEELEVWKPVKAKATTDNRKNNKVIKADEVPDEEKEVETEVIEVKPKPKKQKGVAEGQMRLFD